MPDLLPDDFGTETVTPPVAILREQAEHFGRRMGGLVLARIATHFERPARKFFHQFVLEVPSLDDYALTLFVVSHPIHLYPVGIFSDFYKSNSSVALTSQEDFENGLRDTFAHTEVRRIVAALKAQAVPAAAPA